MDGAAIPWSWNISALACDVVVYALVGVYEGVDANLIKFVKGVDAGPSGEGNTPRLVGHGVQDGRIGLQDDATVGGTEMGDDNVSKLVDKVVTAFRTVVVNDDEAIFEVVDLDFVRYLLRVDGGGSDAPNMGARGRGGGVVGLMLGIDSVDVEVPQVCAGDAWTLAGGFLVGDEDEAKDDNCADEAADDPGHTVGFPGGASTGGGRGGGLSILVASSSTALIVSSSRHPPILPLFN